MTQLCMLSVPCKNFDFAKWSSVLSEKDLWLTGKYRDLLKQDTQPIPAQEAAPSYLQNAEEPVRMQPDFYAPQSRVLPQPMDYRMTSETESDHQAPMYDVRSPSDTVSTLENQTAFRSGKHGIVE